MDGDNDGFAFEGHLLEDGNDLLCEKGIET
jgi:hypothetical protein